jgi:DNA adenine methylase
MMYLGGKTRLAPEIAAAVLACAPSRARLVEPFAGSCAITEALAPHFSDVTARDLHPDLILMHTALQAGWVPPATLSEDEYRQLRDGPPSALRGFAGFGVSFSGKWFGGYARNSRGDDYCGQASRSASRRSAALKSVRFECGGYASASVAAGDVVYCDPPYAGTTGYSGSFSPPDFWAKADAWVDLGATVFVSEYTAPWHWLPVWTKPRKQSLRGNAGGAEVVESLFMRIDALPHARSV